MNTLNACYLECGMNPLIESVRHIIANPFGPTTNPSSVWQPRHGITLSWSQTSPSGCSYCLLEPQNSTKILKDVSKTDLITVFVWKSAVMVSIAPHLTLEKLTMSKKHKRSPEPESPVNKRPLMTEVRFSYPTLSATPVLTTRRAGWEYLPRNS